MKFIRTKLSFVLIGAALLAAGLTSVAIAAQHQPGQPACYGTCPTATGLSLSRHVVIYGHEQRVIFRVVVHPRVAGIRRSPRGTVDVKTQRITLCMITLAEGRGTCSPSSRALAPRRHPYWITAHYKGNARFSGSKSRHKYLKIIHRPRR